jgi:hypothetical protein
MVRSGSAERESESSTPEPRNSISNWRSAMGLGQALAAKAPLMIASASSIIATA